jgi:hypothetical protein
VSDYGLFWSAMYRYSSNPGISELPKWEMLLILRRRFDGTNVLPALDLAGKPRCELVVPMRTEGRLRLVRSRSGGNRETVSGNWW